MDTIQFATFIKSFSESKDRMASTLFSSLSEQIQRSDSNIGIPPEVKSQAKQRAVSKIPPFDIFEPKKEHFKDYLERFESYLIGRNVDPNGKVQLLIASIGSCHLHNLSTRLGPDRILEDLNYESVCQAFNDMFSRQKSPFVYQHQFLSNYQKPNQSIAEFAVDLQKDLLLCQFAVVCECDKRVSVASLFLRAQFVRGLRDGRIREHLLQSMSELSTLEDLLEAAVELEKEFYHSNGTIGERLAWHNRQQLCSSNSTLNDVKSIPSSSPSRSRRCNQMESPGKHHRQKCSSHSAINHM